MKESYYNNFLGRMVDITAEDNKNAFVEMISSVADMLGGYDELMSEKLSTIMFCICNWNAVKCATALFEEPISLKLDLNAISLHSTPLQSALPSPGLIELFLRNGARADIRSCFGTLPLDDVLDMIRNKLEFTGWFPEQSIYMTIVFLCKQGELLKSVRLLFENTEEVENEIKRYVKVGKLIHLAALLMVVREELTSPSFFKGLHDSTLNGSMSLRQLALSEMASLTASQITLVSTGEEMQERKNKLETMTSMVRLIEVFERVGDKIEFLYQYLTAFSGKGFTTKKYEQNVTIEVARKRSEQQVAVEVACLLINAGFAEYKDFEINHCIPDDNRESEAEILQEYRCFLESLENKLWGETGKIYKHVLGTMPSTLEAIPVLNNEDDAMGYLPLNLALEKLCHHPYLNDYWVPEKSTFKLVCILCLPQLKDSLESIRLVVSKIKGIEAICCYLARNGKLIELASLLMVAREKLIITASTGSSAISSSIRQGIMSDIQTILDAEFRLMGRSNTHKLVQKYKEEKEMKLNALLLLEVFERAGSCINQYLQSDTYNEVTSELQIVREIHVLLENAGFALNQRETDLNNINCNASFDRTSSSTALDPVVSESSSTKVDPEFSDSVLPSGTHWTSLANNASLPLATQPRPFSIEQHPYGTRRGHQRTPLVHGLATTSRPFQTMVHKNLKCCSSQGCMPTWNLKPGLPNISWNKIGWFLSLGVAITKVVKRV